MPLLASGRSRSHERATSLRITAAFRLTLPPSLLTFRIGYSAPSFDALRELDGASSARSAISYSPTSRMFGVQRVAPRAATCARTPSMNPRTTTLNGGLAWTVDSALYS